MNDTATIEGHVAIKSGVASVDGHVLQPNEEIHVYEAKGWMPVRVGTVTVDQRLVVTISDGSPPSPDAGSFPIDAGARIRIKRPGTKLIVKVSTEH